MVCTNDKREHLFEKLCSSTTAPWVFGGAGLGIARVNQRRRPNEGKKSAVLGKKSFVVQSALLESNSLIFYANIIYMFIKY